jgi:PadR family transcriptional regulator, regulatory protein AphA
MSNTDKTQLTTTSYAILGLLIDATWSTYALAKQMRRTLHHIWPRAESNIYAEPKRLAALGLAKAETDMVGNRPRTLYTITAKGRRAFERWLDTPSAPSRFESETLLKVLFADYGSKDQLLATLERFTAEVEETREFLRGIAAEYVRGEGPFPERLHVNALFFRQVWDQTASQLRWAQWATEQVQAWPATATPADPTTALNTFRAALRPPDTDQPATRNSAKRS